VVPSVGNQLTTRTVWEYKHSRSWAGAAFYNLERTSAAPMKQLHGASKVPRNTHAILLVEDEVNFLELLGRFLSRRGYTVFRAPDADIAMDIYQKEKIDAVLLDIKLPRTSGCDLFAKMKTVNPAVKVVISSGYLDSDLEAQLLSAGARCAIHKPYSLKELEKVLQETIDS
jgi:two-component system, cell cycle sensor histidine kinase and response regulator CckA